MQVAESVDIEDIRETRSEEEILRETRDHMPWVALKKCKAGLHKSASRTYVENGGKEVDTEGRYHRDNKSANWRFDKRESNLLGGLSVLELIRDILHV